MKTIIIGCTHAGTAAALNAKKLYPDIDITVYEKNDNISFLSCGIALYIEGVVKDRNGLFYSSPKQLKEMGINAKMKHEVIDVDVNNHKIKVKDLETNKVFEDYYDKLIVTTGSWPIVPNIKGIKMENILLSKNFQHSNVIIEKAKIAQNIVVIGAGYIGVELVEAFERMGKKVTLIDMQDRILSKYLDKEITDIAENKLLENKINLALNEKVQEFIGENNKVNKVITDKNEYKTDLVILCIGFKPSTKLFENKLNMTDDGAIIVDEYMKTSNKDILAAGDSCAVKYNPTNTHKYIPLATNAVRMGTLVAMNLYENKIKYMGTQGTSGIKIYNHNIASTGLTEVLAKENNINFDTVIINENNRPEFMPTYYKLTLKLVYEKESHRILGAQIISDADLTQSINTLSICIQKHMTIEELAFVDFFFQPHYNKPWNFLNTAALKVLEKEFK
ncbi:NADH oxidase [Tepiditoga spiralis]|uniref:NADH oxidase n=1 Tax=Tepiditoga spiralis TaxID=2108365 RepID=A0A7G1G5Q4_9BACT|nr:FAD-dependent oxidoreductase [Tepiditoga spiralis]BBE30113.1 NADH oxidase [Tepiditoga spiralis]